MNILNVTEQPFLDNSITELEYHTYQPFVSSKFDYNDEIRIAIQELDAYTLPSQSLLYIEGNLTKEDGTAIDKLRFVNNAFSFLFREIRYELNGVVIDSVRNVGLTSTLKAYLSYNESESLKLQNAGWFPKETLISDSGKFNVCIPLSFIMGFFEDFKKIILNMKQELVLIRNSNDFESVTAVVDESPKITVDKIYWRVPHVSVDIPQQLALTKILNKNIDIPIYFRSWELVEFPSVPENTRHTWSVKTTTKLETPRHVIVAFQTDKKNKVMSNMSKFDDCNLVNLRVFLNSERYPYNDLFLDFKNNKYASLYHMFAAFRASYYESENEPIFSPKEFKTIAPIAHVDCSRQKETVQSSSVIVRIEFETSENIPKNTSAYCLILHDRVFYYNPLTKIVKQR